METITVYKDIYQDDQKKLMDLQYEHYTLRGTVCALADIIKTNPKFVADQLQELAEKFQSGVDTPA